MRVACGVATLHIASLIPRLSSLAYIHMHIYNDLNLSNGLEGSKVIHCTHVNVHKGREPGNEANI